MPIPSGSVFRKREAKESLSVWRRLLEHHRDKEIRLTLFLLEDSRPSVNKFLHEVIE
jgi:hypothetical protein